jgi:Fe-S-cluster containining protein
MQLRDSFNCVMCGRCCANQDLVQLTVYEMYRLADHLGIPPVDFFNKYCELTATNMEPHVHLYIKTIDRKCPFLNDKKCSVHIARPYACRAYPMRAYMTRAGDMKKFVRERYPMLEETCSMFGLEDSYTLQGDVELLADQTICWWVDDAYFNALVPESIDLSVPEAASSYLIRDEGMRQAAKAFVMKQGGYELSAEKAYGRTAMLLKSIIWGTSITFLPEVTSLSIKDNPKIGKFALVSTGKEYVDGMRALVQGSRMDMARAFVEPSQAKPGISVISAIHGSTADHVAIGFQILLEEKDIKELSPEGRIAVFFVHGDDLAHAVGFSLAIKQ